MQCGQYRNWHREFTTIACIIIRCFCYLRLIFTEQRLEAWPSRLCIAGVFMSGGSSWRSPSTADQYRHHDYADFAQEFLHRNSDYRDDHAATLARITQFPHTAQEEQEGLARRWGLCFPHRSSNESAREPCTVVARRCSRCGHRRSRRPGPRDSAAARS